MSVLVSLVPGLAAQDTDPSVGFLHLRSVSGEVSLLGQYQRQYSAFNDIREKQNSHYFIGGMRLNTSSYLWQPDIVSIQLSGEYNPETRNEKYLSIPDRSEVRTLKKLDLRTTVFSDKSISLSSYLNVDQSYFNRENLTNIKSNNRQWGGILSLNNRVLPLNVSFRSLDWQQTETESGRQFEMNQNSIEGRASRSIYGNDKHELRYSYDDYRYLYADQNEINNQVHRLSLNEQFFFDRDRKFAFYSLLNYYKQAGNLDFNKFEANERIHFRLPHNLDVNASYNYYRMEDPVQLISINRIRGSVRHRLFESLTSEVFSDVSRTHHTAYEESDFKAGIEFRYTKKTRIGQLNLGYRYFRQHNNTESEESILNILQEEHTLSDFEGTFLQKPYVEAGSILVTDVSGTVIYQEGLDYIIDEINYYTEIIRIPGGQILNDQLVLISYSATQPGNIRYKANNSSFDAGLYLFNKLLHIYYKTAIQKFKDVEAVDLLTLNQYTQNVVGGKVYYHFLTGGVEYDYFQSSIIPYRRINYYLNLNFKFRSRFFVSVNGLLRDYMLLGDEVNHRYINVSGRVAYTVNKWSKVNVQTGYLNQQGKGIDLDLLTGRLEYVANLRDLYLTAGINLYLKQYTNSHFDYSRAFVRLARKF